MGQLIEGKWHTANKIVGQDEKDGKFKREATSFHHSIEADPNSQFTAEVGRYHLYISYACPWACRALIMRKLKKLDDVISLSIVHPLMAENGWQFSEGDECIADTVNHFDFLHQVYTKADPTYTGRVSVPVLWDKKTQTIVNNESSEIMRIFNSAFDQLTGSDLDFYPQAHRAEIDEVNEFVYHNINNGVYKCGFALTQEAYNEAYDNLFAALDQVEQSLSKQRYLVGEQMTEADWRLFTTLVRFDAVYVGHFKCNKQQIAEYHHIQNYLRELYQLPGIAETVNMQHIKAHYYRSHAHINPTQIVPAGPKLSLDAPHDRASL